MRLVKPWRMKIEDTTKRWQAPPLGRLSMARHTTLRYAGTAVLGAAVSLKLIAFPAKSLGREMPAGGSRARHRYLPLILHR